MLAACGFTPVHRLNENRVGVASVKAETSAQLSNQLLARSLRERLRLSETGVWHITVAVSQSSSDSQLDASGDAQRTQLQFSGTIVARHADDDRQRNARFTETLSLAGSDSAADEMQRKRELTDLALQQLADRMAAFVAALPREKRTTQEGAREDDQEAKQ
ncbi:MAG: hypothetical protein ACON4V_04260 [Parvibaculales bacterium]